MSGVISLAEKIDELIVSIDTLTSVIAILLDEDGVTTVEEDEVGTSQIDKDEKEFAEREYGAYTGEHDKPALGYCGSPLWEGEE